MTPPRPGRRANQRLHEGRLIAKSKGHGARVTLALPGARTGTPPCGLTPPNPAGTRRAEEAIHDFAFIASPRRQPFPWRDPPHTCSPRAPAGRSRDSGSGAGQDGSAPPSPCGSGSVRSAARASRRCRRVSGHRARLAALGGPDGGTCASAADCNSVRFTVPWREYCTSLTRTRGSHVLQRRYLLRRRRLQDQRRWPVRVRGHKSHPRE